MIITAGLEQSAYFRRELPFHCLPEAVASIVEPMYDFESGRTYCVYPRR